MIKTFKLYIPLMVVLTSLFLCSLLMAEAPDRVTKDKALSKTAIIDLEAVDGNRLYLLDFDLYCMADPGLDIGNFIGHLTEYALRSMGDSRALTHIKEEMAQRFAELYDEAACHSMHIYTLLTLVRHIYLSTRVEKRSIFTKAILELCEKRLAAEAHATTHSQ